MDFKKNVGRGSPIKITKAMLSLPIKWIEVNKTIIIKTKDVFEKTKLDPRNSIHIASMKELGQSSILSGDIDFDEVDGIKRVSVSEFMKKI